MMRSPGRKLYSLSVIIGMLSTAILGLGAVEPMTDRPSRVVISSPRTTYAVAEPITLLFDLINDSHWTIKGYYHFDLSDGPQNSHMRITYRRKDDLPHVYALRGDLDPVRDVFFIEPIRIPSHGRLSTQILLLYDRGTDRFVFNEPGSYEFRLKFEYDSGKTMESNSLRVTVTPGRQQEMQALEIWKNPYLARAIQGNSVEQSKESIVIERLSTLVTKFSSSIYTKDAREAIINLYEERARQGQLDRFQESLLELVKLQR